MSEVFIPLPNGGKGSPIGGMGTIIGRDASSHVYKTAVITAVPGAEPISPEREARLVSEIKELMGVERVIVLPPGHSISFRD